MTTERKGQIPFDLGVDLVTNLDTGDRTLQRRRTRTSAGGQMRVPVPTRQWWERRGLMAFNKAAEGWIQGQSAKFAEEFGHNVESAGPRMTEAETEESLKKVFRKAKRSKITSLEVVGMMKEGSLNLERRLGPDANLVPMFVDSAIDLLAEVYGLKPSSTEDRKRFAHQRQLPQFS